MCIWKLCTMKKTLRSLDQKAPSSLNLNFLASANHFPRLSLLEEQIGKMFTTSSSISLHLLQNANTPLVFRACVLNYCLCWCSMGTPCWVDFDFFLLFYFVSLHYKFSGSCVNEGHQSQFHSSHQIFHYMTFHNLCFPILLKQRKTNFPFRATIEVRCTQ